MKFISTCLRLLCLLVLVFSISTPHSHAYTLGDTWPDFTAKSQTWDFKQVTGIAMDSQGRVHVADPSNNVVKVFDSSGNFLCLWGDLQGSQYSMCSTPVDLYADGQGLIYVNDVWPGRILVYDEDGSLIRSIEAGESYDVNDVVADAQGQVYALFGADYMVKVYDIEGNVVDEWDVPVSQNVLERIEAFWSEEPQETIDSLIADNYPRALTLDAQGRVCVANFFSVQIFSPSGELQDEWLAADEPESPAIGSTGTSWLVDIAVDASGDIMVLDSRNFSIRRYDSAGNKLAEWSTSMSDKGLSSYGHALCLGPQGEVYMGGDYRVAVYSEEGALLSQWSVFGTGPGEFYGPSAIACANGRHYVAEPPLYRVQVLNELGEQLDQWDYETAGNDLYYEFRAMGLASDSEGNVYMTEGEKSEVLVFDPQGTLLNSFAGHGGDPGEMYIPMGICLDSQDNVYVADQGAHAVHIFTKDGEYLSSWGEEGEGEGQFASPTGLAMDGQGSLYVTDIHLNRIQVFDSQGNFLRAWGEEGFGQGQFEMPRDITIDLAGYVHVADSLNSRIQVFTQEGKYVTTYGAGDFPETALDTPYSLALCKNSGFIYAADYADNRIRVFTPAEEREISEYAGWWWEGSDKPGTGIALGTLSGKLYMAWLAYDDSGQSTWYSALFEEENGGFSGPLVKYTGWPLNDDTPAIGYEGETIGQASLSFTATDQAYLTYTIEDTGVSYYKTLSRYWSEMPDSRDFSDWWLDSSRDGMGLFIEARGDKLFAGWYHYREDGSPRWWIALGDFPEGATGFSAPLLEYEGGQSLTGEYQDPVSVGEQGDVTIVFTGDSTATMDWNGRMYFLERQD